MFMIICKMFLKKMQYIPCQAVDLLSIILSNIIIKGCIFRHEGMPEGIYILLVAKYPLNKVLISEKIFFELLHVIVDMTVKKCLKCQKIKMSGNLINIFNLKSPI